VLSTEEREAIRRLAADIPALWEAETTTVVERKEVIRQAVERVVVDGTGGDEQIRVSIEWAGGSRTAEVVTRSVRSWEQPSYYPQPSERVRVLTEAGLSASRIAEQLNAGGYRSPKRSGQPEAAGVIGEEAVKGLRRRLGLSRKLSRPEFRDELGRHEW